MSTTAWPLDALVPARPTWARVDTDFYVASRDGEFVGYVDRAADGTYIAFDGRSTPVGRYDDLRDAQRAAEGVTSPAQARKRRRVTRALQKTAAVTGVVAGGVALTAGALAPYL